jgi:hypothetical protein
MVAGKICSKDFLFDIGLDIESAQLKNVQDINNLIHESYIEDNWQESCLKAKMIIMAWNGNSYFEIDKACNQ